MQTSANKIKSSFSLKLALRLAALSVLGLVVVFIVINTAVRDVMYENIVELTQKEQTIHAGEIDSWFGAAVQTIENLADTLRAMDTAREQASVIQTMYTPLYYQTIAEHFTTEIDFIDNIFIGFPDGSFVNGLRWQPDPGSDWSLFDRPWYIAARETPGELAILDAFWSNSGQVVASALSIWLPDIGDEGVILGFSITLDYILSRINQDTALDDGYLILINKDGQIIAHPEPYYALGPDVEIFNLRDYAGGDFILDSIASGENFARVEDVRIGSSHFYATPLSNIDWLLIAIIPLEATEAAIFANLALIMLSFLAFLLVLFATVMFFTSRLARKEAETRANLYEVQFDLDAVNELRRAEEHERELLRRERQISDASPIASAIWDDETNLVFVNEAAIRLLGMRDVDDFIERFPETLPEFQRCGTPTLEKMVATQKEAIEKGYLRIEWQHINVETGELVPCELTSVRINNETGDGYLLATYLRDLRESEKHEREYGELNEIFVKSSPLVMDIWDSELSIISSNPRAKELFELDSVEEYAERFFELSPERQPCGRLSREMAIEYNRKAFEEGRANFEWTHQKLNGELIPAEITLERFTRNGKHYLVGFTMDSRPAMAMRDKEIAEAEWEKFKNLFNSAPFGCAIHDTNYEILDVNSKTMELLEITNKQEYLTAPFSFYPKIQPDGIASNERTVELINQVLSEGTAMCEWWYKTKSGTLIPCEVSLIRTTVGSKNVIVAWLRDLRDYHEGKEISERAQLMLEATPLIVEYWDEEGNLIDCNQTALEHYGFDTKEEYLARAYENFYSWNEWNEFLHDVFLRGSSSLLIRDPQPDDSITYLEVDAVLVTRNNKPVVVSYASDVTRATKQQKERENLLNKLEKAIENEQSASLAKSRFLSNMSHEIRTPMTAIIGMAGIAKNTDDLAKKNDSILKIDKASKHLLGIINQILDMSKIEAESFELDFHSFDFGEMVGEVVSILSVKVEEKKLALGVDLSPAIPKYIVSDELRLAQVMTNLLTNAVKFTPEGGSVSLTAKLQSDNEGAKNLRVEVCDNGIGIPKEQQADLFDAFVQAESSVARNYGGTGLGLSISKWIIEKMGGNIEIDSEPDKGSRFAFAIPIEEGKPNGKNAAYSAEAAERGSPELFADYTVLVVEDVDINREIVSALLEPTNIKIDFAENGEQALQMFHINPKRYDIIFMDVQMPIMDGMTATRFIREIGTKRAKSIPIIAMTANVFQEDVDKCLESGMNDHLGKPLDFNQIMEKLRLYLALNKG